MCGCDAERQGLVVDLALLASGGFDSLKALFQPKPLDGFRSLYLRRSVLLPVPEVCWEDNLWSPLSWTPGPGRGISYPKDTQLPAQGLTKDSKILAQSSLESQGFARSLSKLRVQALEWWECEKQPGVHKCIASNEKIHTEHRSGWG